MKRTTQAMVAMGAAISLLLGSGLIAFVSDSVRSNGNSLRSGTYAVAPSAHDLQIARVDVNESCDDALYSDGPMTAAISDGEVGLEIEGLHTFQVDNFCLKNAGTSMGSVVMTFPVANVQDTEIGACEATESAAGDLTCSDGDEGELVPVLEAQATPDGDFSSASCIGATASVRSLTETFHVVDTDLAPGETCEIFIGARTLYEATDEQRLAAQTDRVQFDIVFTLEDIST